MTTVDLDHIGLEVEDRQDAVMWLYNRYGPVGDVWNIDQLTYVRFNDEKIATYFLLRFS